MTRRSAPLRFRGKPLPGERRQWVVRCLVPVLLGSLAAGLILRPIYAHAELVTARPAPGAVVTASPDSISLQFSEPPGPDSGLALYGPGFRAIARVHEVVDVTEPTRLVATVPARTPNDYTVLGGRRRIDWKLHLPGAAGKCRRARPSIDAPSIGAHLGSPRAGLALAAAKQPDCFTEAIDRRQLTPAPRCWPTTTSRV